MAEEQSKDKNQFSKGVLYSDMYSDKEQELFIAIANDIKMQPDKYRNGAKLLDSYYGEKGYWETREMELKLCMAIRENPTRTKRDNPVGINMGDDFLRANQKDIDRLTSLLKTKSSPPLVSRLQDAWGNIETRFVCGQFLSKEDAEAALIIAWLLTDPDANKANVGLTKFEQWSWCWSEDSINHRMFAIISVWLAPKWTWQHQKDKDVSLNLIRRAWNTQEFTKPAATGQHQQQGKGIKPGPKPKYDDKMMEQVEEYVKKQVANGETKIFAHAEAAKKYNKFKTGDAVKQALYRHQKANK